MSFKSEATPEHVPYPSQPVDFDEERDNPYQESVLPYTRNSIWITLDEERVRIKNLKDLHLVNLIWYLDQSQYYTRWTTKDQYLDVLRDEARLRGLHPEFLKRAPMPYLKDGRWQILLPNTFTVTYLSPDPDETPLHDMPVADVDALIRNKLDLYLSNPLEHYLLRYEISAAMLYASDEVKRYVIERTARLILDPLP